MSLSIKNPGNFFTNNYITEHMKIVNVQIYYSFYPAFNQYHNSCSER